jgi:hypothetical protein
MRLMPVLDEGICLDFFMCVISSPSTNIWYNKKHKVRIEASARWLKNMLKLVGIDNALINNKSQW